MPVRFPLFFCVWLAAAGVRAQQVFPVKISADKRYLVDAKNQPFPILGRTAWCLVSLPPQGQQKFLDNTKG